MLAITNGFRDARDALVIYQTSDRRVKAARRQTETIEQTLELAELQSEGGSVLRAHPPFRFPHTLFYDRSARFLLD